jgi:hypothetical protein
MAARNPRARHRRHLLEVVQEMKRRLNRMQNLWTTPSYIYVPAEERENSADWRRDRLPTEYPEDNHLEWARVCQQLDEMLGELNELRDFAAMQYHATKPTN